MWAEANGLGNPEATLLDLRMCSRGSAMGRRFGTHSEDAHLVPAAVGGGKLEHACAERSQERKLRRLEDKLKGIDNAFTRVAIHKRGPDQNHQMHWLRWVEARTVCNVDRDVRRPCWRGSAVASARMTS